MPASTMMPMFGKPVFDSGVDNFDSKYLEPNKGNGQSKDSGEIPAMFTNVMNFPAKNDFQNKISELDPNYNVVYQQNS